MSGSKEPPYYSLRTINFSLGPIMLRPILRCLGLKATVEATAILMRPTGVAKNKIATTTERIDPDFAMIVSTVPTTAVWILVHC